MKHLGEGFLLELYKLFFRKKIVIEKCLVHLKYHYIPFEEYKDIWKKVSTYYKISNKVPSFGIIQEQYNPAIPKDLKILEVLNRVNDTPVADENAILISLEDYIKDAISVEFFTKFEELYNSGEKEEARKLLVETSNKVSTFSIEEGGKDSYLKIFSDFKSRMDIKQRKHLNEAKIKTIFGISEIDDELGGVDEGDIFGFLSQSGIGKTKCLRWIGVKNALRGYRVLHIQLEGTEEECEDGYYATWTSQSIRDIEFGDISPEIYKKLVADIDNILIQGGEIYIKSYERFGTFSLLDLISILDNFEKKYGEVPNLILIDYIDVDLVEPGNGKVYKVSQGKEILQAIGRGLKNIALERKTRIGVAFQASDVHPDMLNNPNFVLTRHHTKGDKNIVSPFSIFLSLNQTNDEYEMGIMRIYADKVRKRKRNKIFIIGQDYSKDKFYDHLKTLKLKTDGTDKS